MNKEYTGLLILNYLMNVKDYRSTKDIVDYAKCDRKTVYRCMDQFEVNGFGIDVRRNGYTKMHEYKYIGLYKR